MAYKPKRTAKKSAGNARARRAAARAAAGLSRPEEEPRTVEKTPAQSARVGTRPISEQEVRAAITPILEEFSLVLEEVKLVGPETNRTVQAVVDYTEESTEPVSLDTLAEVSQAFSSALDAADADDEFFPYELQVSSPGATRGLTERRHWLRSRGRLVNIREADGIEYVARLDEVGEDGVVLRRRKETKKGQKPSYWQQQTLAWDRIGAARVEIDFNSSADSVN